MKRSLVPASWREFRHPAAHPRISEWQKEATTDDGKISRWFERWTVANVGIQLGRESGIIDIECDSAEAEREMRPMIALIDSSFATKEVYDFCRDKTGTDSLLRQVLVSIQRKQLCLAAHPIASVGWG